MRPFSSIFFVTLVLGLVPLRGQDKAPAIVFDSITKDFGNVKEGETLKHIFKFSNKGQATLEILSVEPT
jgi:hypothetical protein